MDVTKAEQWNSVLDFAKSKFSGVDILVNNAGWTYRRKDTVTVPEFEYDREY
jgi:3-oxoacyl-[acyl-carrier protein] reductase